MNKYIAKTEQELFSKQDIKYREFQAKLMPNIDKSVIIGVRNPDTKKIAKQIIRDNEEDGFVSNLPHKYYEENNVHAYIITNCKEYSKTISMLDNFLPFVDNWATCDIIKPQIFKKNTDKLINEIRRWVSSNKTYTVRFGIGMLMTFYLDDYFDNKYLKIPLSIKTDEYYIKMMIAWFYATALAKQYDDTIKIIENKVLDKWTHNKSIQKAIESYRITDEQKVYLKTLKI